MYKIADILYDCEERDSSISGKVIADLGCGPGIFCVGSSLLNADFIVGFEIDEDAISDFKQNLEDLDLQNERIDVVNCDVRTLLNQDNFIHQKYFDTVITNPPFGTTKDTNGIDVIFLHTALTMATEHVYSLHKSSTRPVSAGQFKLYFERDRIS
ncbi:Methyltransferase-like protein 5 [Cichlidogyrus casuarinus]|uniref:Methyltransferase-like protein 5 n=1 Tax=Cichlidogyrus casuarinus TaxID=1844966 RepID=A0ABD2Q0W4_9PLAT